MAKRYVIEQAWTIAFLLGAGLFVAAILYLVGI
jgi:hypothetical protein